MIEESTIKKMVNIIKRPHGNSVFDNQIMHIEREWSAGVIFGLSLFLTGIWWSVVSFMQYSSVEVGGNENADVDRVVYRASLVEKALSDFEKKEEIYKNLHGKLTSQNFVPAAATVSPLIDSPNENPETETTTLSAPEPAEQIELDESEAMPELAG